MKKLALLFTLCTTMLSFTACNSFLEGLAMGLGSLSSFDYGNSYASTYGTTYATTPLTSSYDSSSDYSASYDDDTSSSSSKKRCKKLSVNDHAHCGGSGVCSRCNGDGHYLSSGYGISRDIECPTCYGSGICPSCHGDGYR